ncbi:hypothetical protein ACOSQ3_014569 [Xanthoceras sorbifolium]
MVILDQLKILFIPLAAVQVHRRRQLRNDCLDTILFNFETSLPPNYYSLLKYNLRKDSVPLRQNDSENVLAESWMMIPDCWKRLEAALAYLKGTLVELEEVNQEGPEIEDTLSTITKVGKLFQTT